MEMITKRLIIVLLAIMPLWMLAQNTSPGVILELSNGEVIEIILADNPKITFDGVKVYLETAKYKVKYKSSEVSKIKMAEIKDATSLESKKDDTGLFEINGDYIRFYGFEKGAEINVYAMTGMKQIKYIVSSNGCFMLPMSSLSKGISIISIKNQTFKIVKE